MKHKLLQYSSIAAALVFVAVFFGLAIYNTPGSTAVKATDFQAGRIIDDEIFYNKDTMTVAEIQAFLDAKTPACDVWGQKPLGAARYHAWGTAPASMKRADYAKWRREVGGDSRYHDPPYVCVNLYYENPTTHETNFDTNFETKEGMLSAAEIIYQAAQKYNINPQVLLVMLKKESYAWGDDWPIKWGYNTIMGYGCPDTAPCDEKYYGFYNQMMMAAWQLNYYKDHIYSYGYFPYATNSIYYSPDYSCGSKSVYLENIATTSLYIYTPYTPNDAALRNYPGTATCGSYGNRNFFMYFNEWFGTTLQTNTPRVDATDVPLNEPIQLTTKDNSKSIQLKTPSKDKLTLFKVGEKSEDEFDLFAISKNSDNSYRIKYTYSGLSMDINGCNIFSGQTIEQYTDNESIAQKWKFYKHNDGTYSIVLTANTDYAISYHDDELTIEKYTAGDYQKFNIVKANVTEEQGTGGDPTPNDPNTTPNTDNPSNTGDGSAGTTTPSNDEGGTTTPPNGDGSTTTDQSQQNNNTSAQLIEDGVYRIDSILRSNLSLDINGGSSDNGANVQVYNSNNSYAQKWTIKYVASGDYYTITNSSVRKSLDVNGCNSADGTNIQMWQPNTSCAQKWKIRKNADDTYTIISACSNKVLDIKGSGTVNKTNVQLYRDNNSSAQKWKFTKISDSQSQSQSQSQLIENGIYRINSVLRSNFSLDVNGGSTNNGANVQVYNSNNSYAQKWEIKYVSSGDYYTIINPAINKSLDVTGCNSADGTNIEIWQHNTSCAQKWKIRKNTDGTYTIINTCANKALDVKGSGTLNKTNVQLYRDNNSNAQKWQIVAF